MLKITSGSAKNSNKYIMLFTEVQDALAVMESPEFKAWFNGSKVVDANGKPLIVYHGSGTDIKRFDYQFTEQGNDQLGSGFYFTTDWNQAHGYTTHRIEPDKPKLGGEDKPTVISAFLKITKPLDTDMSGEIPRSKIAAIIKASPDLDDHLSDWGDVKYEGRNNVLNTAIDAYSDHQNKIIRTLNMLSNDFYRGHVAEFNRIVKKQLGYDGAFANMGKITHWVAWFPEQIKSVSSKKFDPKSDLIDETSI